MEGTVGEGIRGPLAGIRVLDFSTVMAGPLCTQILGDLGAEVIKVESPKGDTTRRFGAPKGGLSAFFVQVNRNKRSVVIDLKQRSGQEIAQRLARDCDVVMVSFRPGVADRLGIGYETLAADNPGLVYAAVTGFGAGGPYSDQPAYDTVIQGLVGFMRVQGHGDATMVASPVADKTTGMTAAYGVMAALLARERGDGRGQRIEIPMLDAWAAFILPDCLGSDTFVPEDPSLAVFDVSKIHRTWKTLDGEVVIIIIEDHHFRALCQAVERPEIAADARYETLASRIAHLPELFADLEPALSQWRTADLVARAQRFQVPLAPANGVRDFIADPQARTNHIFVECEDAEAGQMRMIRNPVRFQSDSASPNRVPPRLGADTDQVLREAGYGEGEIASLREDGAIA
jgi:crotonobetainyl-CoA:carnitine CoA-transferase CaiB-like acyl-CoA transferase